MTKNELLTLLPTPIVHAIEESEMLEFLTTVNKYIAKIDIGSPKRSKKYVCEKLEKFINTSSHEEIYNCIKNVNKTLSWYELSQCIDN